MVEKKVFDAIALFCETQQVCTDTARELTRDILVALLTPPRRKVYDALTNDPKSLSEIACEVNMTINNTYAVLYFLKKETTLVSYKGDGKRRVWFKS